MSNSVKPALIGTALASCALAGVVIRTLPAQAAPPQNVASQSALSSATPGHYQLQNINGTPYLLDTETGRIWVNQKTVIVPAAGDNTSSADSYSSLTSNGVTMRIPIPKSTWVEDSPTWAKPR